MQKWMWLLPAIALWNVMPAAQAQLVPGYGPRPVGQYGPSVFGRYDPLAPQVPGVPGFPGGYNPLNPTPFPGQPFGLQRWMPPTALDIARQAHTGNPALGHRFGPWPNHDPLNFDPQASRRGQGRLNMDLTAPNVRVDRMPPSANLPPSVNLSKLDPKLFENRPLIPIPSIGEFETRPAAKMGDTRPPAWFCWVYSAGILLISTLAGTLYQIFRRDSLTE